MSLSIGAITAAGRRRQAGLQEIIATADQIQERSTAKIQEAVETLGAITKRSEQNHIAWGVSQAFAYRRNGD